MNRYDLLGVGALSLFTAAAAYGCGDETAPNDNDGEGGSATSTSTTPIGPGPTGPATTTTTGAGGAMDEGTSCADAVPLEEKTNTLDGTFYDYSGVIGEAGDLDYFSFEATAGEWVRLTTDTSDDSGDVNTVITLFDEDGSTQLAQNNNAVTGGLDSELAFHVLETGTYCMQVEDWSTFVGNTPQGGPTYGYRAIMVPIDFDLYEFYNEDTEPNDTTGAPQTGLTFSTGSNASQMSTDLAGLFDTETDVDVYEWVAPTPVGAFNLWFTPDGIDGWGSTLGTGIVNVYQSDGTTILAQLDVTRGADRFTSVPVTAGETYYIEVNAPAGAAAGTNDFYYLKFNTVGPTQLNDQEQDEAGNAAFAAAEVAPPQQDGNVVRHFIGGMLPAPDEDWWSFQASAGTSVALSCSAWRAGGGTRDATFEIYQDPAGAALESEVEGEDADVRWSDTSSTASRPAVSITTAGTHYLRVTATQQDPQVTSAFYLCGIHVNP